MSQDLIFGFQIPVVLALAVAVLVLLVMARVLASMSAPVRVREPGCAAQGQPEQEETAWRF